MASARLGNVGLNVAIFVLGLVMVALVWSLVGGWVVDDSVQVDEARWRGIVQLDVRNGCGVEGLASAMSAWLTGRGVDVVESGDWSRFDVRETHVIDRIGDARPAESVLQRLGLPRDRLRVDVRPDYYLDATLVIGCDYDSLPPFGATDGGN